MEAMRDLTNPKHMFLKGGLFLCIGILSAALLIAEHRNARDAVLLALMTWGFCRAYYFAFYVIEKYVDPGFRFSGLGSFVAFCIRRWLGPRRE